MAVGRGDVDGRRCVLLVEPGSEAADAIIRTLEDHRVEDVLVHRWPELLDQLVEQAPGLVIVDLAMSGDAGTRLIEMVRAAAPDATIVVLSDPDVIEVAALEAGVSLVVSPADLRPLGALLCQFATSEPDS